MIDRSESPFNAGRIATLRARYAPTSFTKEALLKDEYLLATEGRYRVYFSALGALPSPQVRMDIGCVRAKQRIPLFLWDERSERYDGAHDLAAVGPIGKDVADSVRALFDRPFPLSNISAGIPGDELLDIRSELRQAVWREPRGRAQAHFKR
jgi:hypothetical protein